MNQVNLLGRICNELELKYTQGDKPMAVLKFSVAIQRDKEHADFIGCVAFGKTAEVISKYFCKGARIAISGRLSTNSYTNKNGQKVTSTEVLVGSIDFIEKKQQSAEPQMNPSAEPAQQPQAQASPFGNAGFMDIPSDFSSDGLPF